MALAGSGSQPHSKFNDFLAELHASREPRQLVSRLLSGLQSFVPSEYNSWKELTSSSPLTVTAVFAPHNPTAASLLPVFQRHAKSHPLYRHWCHQSRDLHSPLAWTDVASQADIDRLPLYHEFYRPLGIHNQMIVPLETRPSSCIYLALNRGRIPFSQQDRAVVCALQPHLSQVLRALRECQHLRSTLVSYETLLNTMNQGIICLSQNGRIAWANKRAHIFARTYWGTTADCTNLPNSLQSWIRPQLQLGRTITASRSPLLVQGPRGHLLVRLLTENKKRYLLIDEIPVMAGFEKIKSLGLTDREAQVLGWVAQGKSNEEVGMILDMCSQTVKKHLERIYCALGVANRTGAAIKAHEALHGNGGT